MESNVKVFTRNDGFTYESDGLVERFGYELSATVENSSLKDECKEFVKFFTDYIDSGNVVRSNETLMYGYWLTKVVLDDRKRMIFSEYNAAATEFVFGVNLTLNYWNEQHKICRGVSADFSPPRPDQMIVISDGVYEDDDVEGVRYHSPSHMSGWWLTTDRYDGNVNSLKTVHAHHVTEKRPDLAKFIALPNGYRFFSPSGEVWFDEKAAK